MNGPEPRHTLVATRADSVFGRRRIAPKAAETSDVTRFRGIVAATLAGAVAVIGAVLGTQATGNAVLTSERLLSEPHRQAALECGACHSSHHADVDAIQNRCLGCHGPHPSTRAGHRQAAADGLLRCPDCHRSHQADAGVMFEPDGTIVRYAPGVTETVELPAGPTPAFHTPSRVVVPLVPADACARCHRIDALDDPSARCFDVTQAALGPQRPVLCFDEHRDVLEDPEGRRLTAWEAARRVVAAHPSVEAAEPSEGRGAVPALWVGLGLVSAGGALGLSRLVRRLARKPERHDTQQPQVQPVAVVRLPQINAQTCIGCHACVDACPYDVLEVSNYVAQVVRPDDCCGLTLCEQRCPNGSLVVTDGELIGDRPRISPTLESLDRPGVFLAGDITGLPLIRNAINQGAQVIRHIAQSLPRGRGQEVLDVVIVGAGPAGISAALEAKAQGLGYVVLEQGGVAESIRSFPRGKLVFDQPLGMPMVGELWLRESTKEELLGKWMRIIHQAQLAIREQTRVTEVVPVDGGPPSGALETRFVDPNGTPTSIRSRRVVLAFGRRGSPRKLGVDIPEAMQDHVHYSMADARSFAGRKVLVVGLGDVAMEAAIGLARQPDTEVTVSYRSRDFKRGKSRNIAEMKRLIASQRIRMCWGTEVAAVAPGQVTLTGAEGPIQLPVDSIFVMIGTIAPWSFLSACGVKRLADA